MLGLIIPRSLESVSKRFIYLELLSVSYRNKQHWRLDRRVDKIISAGSNAGVTYRTTIICLGRVCKFQALTACYMTIGLNVS